MTGTVIFDALLPWPFLWALTAAAVLFLIAALWRGLAGWWLRGFTAAVLLTALANPALQEEDRAPLSDIVIAVVDDSASQTLGGAGIKPPVRWRQCKPKLPRWKIPNCASCMWPTGKAMPEPWR